MLKIERNITIIVIFFYLNLKINSEVLFQPLQPFYCESFDTCQGLGRVVVIDSNQLVMLGKTIEVEYKD